MRGIGQRMPWTKWAFLAGSLALVGVPPFGGFFSKDAIIAAALHAHWYGVIFWVVGLVGTFLTGLYTFRLYFIVFADGSKAVPGTASRSLAPEPHLHNGREGPLTMLVPVGILTVLAVIGGWIQFAPFWHPLTNWLEPVARTLGVAEPKSWQEALSSVLAVALGLAGMAVAWAVYSEGRLAVPRLPALQRALEHKLYFDEAYDRLFYAPAAALASYLRGTTEEEWILPLGGEFAEVTLESGRLTRRLQTGLLRTYVLFLGTGMAVMAIVFLLVR
jgi:NADH-quinone oxidoreductase subunit L